MAETVPFFARRSLRLIWADIKYWSNAAKHLGLSIGGVRKSARFHRRWHANLDIPPLNSRLPWISFPAIELLELEAKPDHSVFEYGSGGSTLFWADRVKEVVSVEHDAAWFESIKSSLTVGEQSIVQLRHIPPDPDPDFLRKEPGNPKDYVSADEGSRGKNFERYVKFIDTFANEYFDIIVIDGRARPSCIAHSGAKLKPAGLLVVDNTEREYIQAASIKDLELKFDLLVSDFGPAPNSWHFSRTSVWRKR